MKSYLHSLIEHLTLVYRKHRPTQIQSIQLSLDKFPSTSSHQYSVDTGRKLNVQRTFRRRPGHATSLTFAI